MTRRGACAWLGVLAFACSSTAGCLDDLPAPLVCPPPAQNEQLECLSAIQMPTSNCYTGAEVACLRGGEAPVTCDCQSGECPAPPEGSCFPEGSCPDAVLERAGEDAECFRLTGDDIGSGFENDFQCLCGCTSCASLCDGYGTIYGTIGDGMGAASVLINFGGRVPDSGRLGVYMRVRGLPNFQANVLFGNPLDFLVTGTAYNTTENVGDFIDVLYYDVPAVGTPPYTWSTPDAKPTALVLSPLPIDTEPPVLFSLAEIDCIIPFVVPN